MASLVLVATAGASTANTYVTLSDAETYALEFLNTSTWTAATDATKNAALVQATHQIDCLPLIGVKDGSDSESDSDYQPLHFPTSDDVDDTDTAYIPADAERATVVQAMYLIRAGAAEQASNDLMATGVTAHSAGHMSETLSRHSVSPVCAEARRYLKKWLSTSRKLEFA